MLSALSCSCTLGKKSNLPKVEDGEPMQMAEIESATGKQNVYTSMARSVKYNVDIMANNIHKKVFYDDKNQSPKEIIRKVLNVKSGNENQLYDIVRVLDFSLIYAISNLSNNQTYVESNVFAKSAAQLAMAAIKSHKDALFAGKKLKEIERFMIKQNKELQALNQKLSRNGMLSESDLELKKGIEVGLYKLQRLKEFLTAGVDGYGNLSKVDMKKVSLEGRHFYELEDFDKQYTISHFQNAALNNRSEFNRMRDDGHPYDAQQVKQNAIRFYPEIEALELNGYNVKDSIYIENLEIRASKIADNLVEVVSAYKQAEKPEQKVPLLKAAYDQLGVAILAQVELDYDIVRMADLDFAAAQEQVKNQRKAIKVLERSHNLSANEKIELLNKKIEMMELELKESQISAERAVALRGLYFHAGLSPFNKKLMEAKISGIEESLKISFNKDMIEMLAKVESKQKVAEHKDNQWAKDENWLEKLVDEKPVEKEKPINIPQKPESDFDPYIEESYNKLKIMQLGSYRERQNADLEWKMLKELYPEFNNYQPEVDTSSFEGRKVYRLILKSKTGGFRDLCNQLRNDRVECLLR